MVSRGSKGFKGSLYREVEASRAAGVDFFPTSDWEDVFCFVCSWKCRWICFILKRRRSNFGRQILPRHQYTNREIFQNLIIWKLKLTCSSALSFVVGSWTETLNRKISYLRTKSSFTDEKWFSSMRLPKPSGPWEAPPPTQSTQGSAHRPRTLLGWIPPAELVIGYHLLAFLNQVRKT